MKNEFLFNKTADSLYSENFDIFRSNMCHFLHNLEDKQFVRTILKERIIDQYYDSNQIAWALYVLAMLDYVCKENNLPICTNYNTLRLMKMKNMIAPTSIRLSQIMFEDDTVYKKLLESAITEFLKYNILESDIRIVV